MRTSFSQTQIGSRFLVLTGTAALLLGGFPDRAAATCDPCPDCDAVARSCQLPSPASKNLELRVPANGGAAVCLDGPSTELPSAYVQIRCVPASGSGNWNLPDLNLTPMENSVSVGPITATVKLPGDFSCGSSGSELALYLDNIFSTEVRCQIVLQHPTGTPFPTLVTAEEVLPDASCACPITTCSSDTFPSPLPLEIDTAPMGTQPWGLGTLRFATNPDNDGAPQRYRWTFQRQVGTNWTEVTAFGDGLCGPVVWPKFADPGVYRTQLTAINRQGVASGPVSTEFTVSDSSRQPAEVAFLIDRSGSMSSPAPGGGTRLQRAIALADLWGAILQQFLIAGDRSAVLPFFSSTCGGRRRIGTEPPSTSCDPAMACTDDQTSYLATPNRLMTEGQPAVGALLASLAPGGCTPIGEGLLAAGCQFNSMSTSLQRVLVFLSDGYHNTGRHPLDCWANGWLDGLSATDARRGLRIHTLGLGQDQLEADAGLLYQLNLSLPAGTSGSYQYVTTDQDPNLLVMALLQSLLEPFDVEVTDVSTLPGIPADGWAYRINLSENDALLGITWTNLDQAIVPTTLTAPKGTTYAFGSSGAVASVQGPGYAFFHVKEAELSAGVDEASLGQDWKITGLTLGGALLPDPHGTTRPFLIQRPHLRARFDVAAGPHPLGQPIRVYATLSGRGRPVTGLRVTAEVNGPGGSVAQVAAAVAPRIANQLRPLLTGAPPAVPALPGRGRPDRRVLPQDPRGLPDLLHERIRAYLQRERLRDQLQAYRWRAQPGLVLADDGRPPDRLAGDGVYSGQFVPRSGEGTYTFRFKAEGRNREFGPILRTGVHATLVELQPSPGTTVTRVARQRVGPRDRYSLTITPKDAQGNLLGPFQAELFGPLFAPGSRTPAKVRDNLDGTYTILLDAPLDRPVPVRAQFRGRTLLETRDVRDRVPGIHGPGDPRLRHPDRPLHLPGAPQPVPPLPPPRPPLRPTPPG